MTKLASWQLSVFNIYMSLGLNELRGRWLSTNKNRSLFPQYLLLGNHLVATTTEILHQVFQGGLIRSLGAKVGMLFTVAWLPWQFLQELHTLREVAIGVTKIETNFSDGNFLPSYNRSQLPLVEGSLTHWSLAKHILSLNLVIIAPDNGLLPVWHQAIWMPWLNAGLLSIGTYRMTAVKFQMKLKKKK